MDRLLARIEKSVPTTGLQQFWQIKALGVEVPQMLWNHVIFSHQHFSTVIRDKFFTPTVAQCYDYLHGMTLDNGEVAQIEATTQDQTECGLWFALRNGRLTSSRFGEILNQRSSTDSRRLVRDIMGYGGPMKTLPPQIHWGKENEERARKHYIENRKDVGELMEVLPSGLHLMPEKAYLGASTDGIVVCRSVDTCCIGCLEIKCPYSIDGNITVEMSPQNIAEKFDDFFLKKGADGELYLPHSHCYYAQVQGELAITNKEWCDFVVFSNNEVVVDRILADLEYWNHLEEKLEEFYVHHVIPEILSGKIFLEEFGIK